LPNEDNAAQFATMNTATLTLKKPVRPRIRPAIISRPAKFPRPSIAEWAKKYAGIAHTGIKDLSTREGFDD